MEVRDRACELGRTYKNALREHSAPREIARQLLGLMSARLSELLIQAGVTAPKGAVLARYSTKVTNGDLQS